MLHVTCAIIEAADKVLICQRSERMSMPLKWEFPGGKIEPGETKAACLTREIKEELNLDIIVGQPLMPVTHDYEHFSLQLYPFICECAGGALLAREHARAIWVGKDELRQYDWATADVPVVEAYLML